MDVRNIDSHLSGLGVAKLYRFLIGELSTQGATVEDQLNAMTTGELVFHNGILGVKSATKVTWLNDVEILSTVTNLSQLLGYDLIADPRSSFKVLNVASLKQIANDLLNSSSSGGNSIKGDYDVSFSPQLPVGTVGDPITAGSKYRIIGPAPGVKVSLGGLEVQTGDYIQYANQSPSTGITIASDWWRSNTVNGDIIWTDILPDSKVSAIDGIDMVTPSDTKVVSEEAIVNQLVTLKTEILTELGEKFYLQRLEFTNMVNPYTYNLPGLVEPEKAMVFFDTRKAKYGESYQIIGEDLVWNETTNETKVDLNSVLEVHYYSS